MSWLACNGVSVFVRKWVSTGFKECVSLCTAMTIKKKIQTKFRLPILNWTPLKPQQVKGTVFSELDDEKLYSVSQTLLCLCSHLIRLVHARSSDPSDRKVLTVDVVGVK